MYVNGNSGLLTRSATFLDARKAPIRAAWTCLWNSDFTGVDAVLDNVGGQMMFAPYRMIGLRGIRVCYAIPSGLNDAGSLLRPSMKAPTRQALWSASPNGHRATFYNAWSKHGLRRPFTFRTHPREDLNRVLGLLADAPSPPTSWPATRTAKPARP